MEVDAAAQPSHEIFVHIRIIVGMILGLSVARLVSGATRFIQHPGKEKIYPVHFAWVICIFLFIIHFWWFEFALSQTRVWTFGLYFLLISYSIMFVMLAAMLFPDEIREYEGFRDYFERRRSWFYALLIGLFVIDVVDTLVKGEKYYHHYGLAYPVRQALLIAGAAAGLAMRSPRYDAVYAALALAAQVVWIAVLFDVLA
ncbi:MAG TPA: hypothetical protein PL183_04840 [Aquamicrobium sp.]|nr:hypothetical protein [Aquamicrobium sp.]